MGIMATNRIIILSVLFAQTLSAPTGCIESCNIYHTSYQSRSSSGYQDHAGLVEGSTNINDHDYTRPGNWTEHNQYSTDSGHGKVHEERGQYVEGSKKVRYYKKNFTSSYGNANGLDAREFDDLSSRQRYDSMRVPSNQHLDSQSIQSGQTVLRGGGYNQMHSQQTQSSSMRMDSRSERLEDFGEYGHSQVNQRVPIVGIARPVETQHHVEEHPSNWSRVDSYRTDGGHGRVSEEEGQYVTGPKKVRYYKKNYTSSYSTSDVPQIDIGSATVNELHNELQRNLHKELDNIRREFHQTSSVGHTASSTHVGSVNLAQETVSLSDLQTAESRDNYRQQSGYGHVPSTESVHHYADQQHRETIDTRRVPHTYPTANTYGSENQRTYESRETYTSRVHPPQSQPGHLSPGYIQVPDTHGSYQTGTHSRGSSHMIDESQRTEVMGTHQSSVAQNQLVTGSSQHTYKSSPSYGTYPVRGGETRHYEERWSASSREGNLAPEYSGHLTHGTADRAHYDRVAYNEHRDRYHGARQDYDARTHASESSYNSAYRSNTGQLVTGSLNVGQAAQGADCTEEVQQYQQGTRYHRKYKRDAHHGRYDDSQQQTQAFGQELQQERDTQQLENLTQQNEELTQQTEGQLEFQEQNVDNQHQDLMQQTQDDFTQQTSGKLEFGQQSVDDQHVNDHHLEDLTQQSEQHTQQIDGKFEFGRQTVGNQQHALEDLTQESEQLTQQTQGSDDFTQHRSGKLEFGQHTVEDQYINTPHSEDLTQQSEQYAQQEGQFEFGQQTVGDQQMEDLTQQNEQQEQFGEHIVGNQSLEDLKQQSEPFVQQTEGQFEFGQQSVGDQHLEDLKQQSEPFTQQTGGQFEFGQQTVSDQHLEDLMQQSEQHTQQKDGVFEFGQQTVDNQQNEQFTQQMEKLRHQTVSDQHLEDLMQQSEQHTQQKDGVFEFGQQTVDNQQNEQFTQQMEKLRHQIVGDQHLEDLKQQSEPFTQQTEGQFELGQQTVDNQDSKQKLEQFTQRTTRSENLMQQTGGVFEFGQQTLDNRSPKDSTQSSEQFTQQTEGQLEFGQHNVDNQYLDNLTQQRNEHFIQQTQGSDDFTQQTSGKLEFSQQVQQADKPTRPRNQHFEEFGQQDEDLTQQEGEFDEFTPQAMGKLEFGQEPQGFNKPNIGNQHLEDFTEQDKDFNQQFGRLEQLEQMSQKMDLNQDFTQQTNHDQSASGMIKPAPKPRPRQRNQQRTSQYTDKTYTNLDVPQVPEVNPLSATNYRDETIQRTSQVQYPSNAHLDRLEILNQQSQGSNIFDNEKENMDRLHWVHKSNDATMGLQQWHYTYHPSDLTYVEEAHDRYYPPHHIDSQQTEDLQQQSRPFDFSQQETQDQHTTFEDTQLNLHDSQLSQHNEYDQQSASFQQSETSPFGNQRTRDSEETPLGVIPLQEHAQNTQQIPRSDKQSQSTEETEYKLEPRILQAYGGGPYDASRNEDIYSRVTPNPSATLPPIDDEDPWDIQEKPRQMIPRRMSVNTISTPKAADITTERTETTPQMIQTTTVQEAPPSFWNKLGNKLSSTYDKAKEKAKEFFG